MTIPIAHFKLPICPKRLIDIPFSTLVTNEYYWKIGWIRPPMNGTVLLLTRWGSPSWRTSRNVDSKNDREVKILRRPGVHTVFQPRVVNYRNLLKILIFMGVWRFQNFWNLALNNTKLQNDDDLWKFSLLMKILWVCRIPK